MLNLERMGEAARSLADIRSPASAEHSPDDIRPPPQSMYVGDGAAVSVSGVVPQALETMEFPTESTAASLLNSKVRWIAIVVPRAQRSQLTQP